MERFGGIAPEREGDVAQSHRCQVGAEGALAVVATRSHTRRDDLPKADARRSIAELGGLPWTRHQVIKSDDAVGDDC